MSRNKDLNFILKWLNENNGTSTKSFSEIIEPNLVDVTPEKQSEYLSKLKSDSQINLRTGFGKHNFEIQLTDSGRTFISNGGYREYSDEVLSIVRNEKALDKFIEVYNKCYYKNMTFDYFYNQLQRMIDKNPSKKITLLLFKQGFIEGLPIDFEFQNQVEPSSPSLPRSKKTIEVITTPNKKTRVSKETISMILKYIVFPILVIVISGIILSKCFGVPVP